MFRTYSSLDIFFCRVSRLDDDSNAPCMNPEAPDPPAGGSGANQGAAGKEKEAGGAPDYAALLQYLQFYQKQMDDKQK